MVLHKFILHTQQSCLYSVYVVQFGLVWLAWIFGQTFVARVHHQHIIFISQNGNEHGDALQNRPDMRHRYILINKSAGAISNATPDDWCLMCNWRKSYPLMAIKYEYSYVALLRTNNSPKNMRSFLPHLVVVRHGFLIRFECLFLVSMSFYRAHSIRARSFSIICRCRCRSCRSMSLYCLSVRNLSFFAIAKFHTR